jgi:hypothetical protein
MTTPAGWYPDPAGGSFRRYWDGYRWTSATDLADTTESSTDVEDDELIDLSIDEYLMLSLDDGPSISGLVQRRIADAVPDATPAQRIAFGAIMASVLNLELLAINARSEARQVASYVLDLETRLVQAGFSFEAATGRIIDL